MNRLKIREPKLDVRDVLPLAELDVLVTRWWPSMSVANGWEWAAVFTTGRCKTGSSIGLQPVGYAHDCQQVDSLPSEEWDIPLPAVITPGKTWCW
ncbi:5-formyltetrahydrofolate cyclo-ligase [Klebsiella pneumoniae]|nr:5-formyltetrahydrofolate cyclo-ligase [Klebsiella pneumoniae]